MRAGLLRRYGRLLQKNLGWPCYLFGKILKQSRIHPSAGGSKPISDPIPPMKRPSLSLLFTATALLSGAAATSNAASIVVAPTASTAGSINITHDITVIVTVAGSASYLALDEWVIADGATTNAVVGSPTAAQSFQYSLNGSPNKTGASQSQIYDNLSIGAATVNDGLLIFDNSSSGNALSVGQTFTLRAGSFGLNSGPGFNPQATQTFTGNVFLMSSGGVRLSANTPAGAVPEPGTALLGALAGLTLLRRRRK